MFIAKPEAERAGFHFWKPLVWDKQTIGMGYHYRARYEFVLFFEKGKRRLNNLGTADVISVPRVHRGYPAEKPPAVSEVLIQQSTAPGELVADPFMGSGSVGVAALPVEVAQLRASEAEPHDRLRTRSACEPPSTVSTVPVVAPASGLAR